MPKSLNCACVNFKDSHLLDHIAPLSYILNVPLYLENESNFLLTKKYYPKVNAIFENPLDFFSLVQQYNSLIECKFWINLDLYKTFFNKNLKLLFCPHGNSDKGRIEKDLLRSYIQQDGVLLYGNHMIDLLKTNDIFNQLKSYSIVGNFRLAYYLKFKKFYDYFIQNEIFNNLNYQNKTILYAPTWKDLENSTSFFDIYPLILKNLPSNFNLIIKFHPLLEKRNSKEFYELYDDKSQKNVIHLLDFPLIYPLLNKIDIYLGDFSSIGYDFLFFQRPMFFLDPLQRTPNTNLSLELHHCGIQIPQKYWGNVFDFIKRNLAKDFKKIQKKRYEYAFGKFLTIPQIKQNIVKNLDLRSHA